MKATLFDDYPIILDRVLAQKIGLNEAIVLQQVHYWIGINKRQNKNFKEGRYWVFNSIKKWQEETFYFWSMDTVKRTFKRLEDAGLLISGSFNKNAYDRTKWYSIDYDVLNSTLGQNAPTEKNDDEKCTNPLGQNAPIKDKGKMHQPIPYTKQRLTNTTSSQVDELWSLYPNKKGKSDAYKKIPLLISKYGFEEIKKCVERYSLEVKDKDKKFMAYGSTFFNGRFEDYLDGNYEPSNNQSKNDNRPKYDANGFEIEY